MKTVDNIFETLSNTPTNTLLILLALAIVAFAAYAIHAMLVVTRDKDK